MNRSHDRKLSTMLFNPFVSITGGPALVLGLGAILLAGLVGSFGQIHFDGVLDTHIGTRAPLWFFLAEGIVDWLSLALVLLLFGKIIARTSFRATDLLGTQALARWPTVLTSLVASLPAVRRFVGHVLGQMIQGLPLNFNTPDAPVFFAALAAMLLLLIWTIALMHKSYSASCHVTGAKAIGTFVIALILAEILSKIALFCLWKLV